MSRSTPLICGIICQGDNFPEFDAAFRDTSLEFREAGEGFESGMMPVLALPVISAYTNSGGDVDQVTFLSDKRAMENRIRALKEDNISLLCCLLKSLSTETKDRLTSYSAYKALRKNMDVIGIYTLLEKLCVDQGSGVNSLGLIAIGFMSCNQDTLSFDKYVLKFRHTLATLDRLGAPVNGTIAVSKFLLSVNTQDCSDVVGRLLASKVLPSLDECIHAILLAKQAQATLKAVRIASSSVASSSSESTVKVLAVKSATNRYSQESCTSSINDDRDAVGSRSGSNNSDRSNRYFCCFNCGLKNHKSSQCNEPQAQCRKCNQLGHLAEFCRNSSRSNDGRSINSNKAKLTLVSDHDDEFMF